MNQKQQIKHEYMIDLFTKAHKLTKQRQRKAIGKATKHENRPSFTWTWLEKLMAILRLKIATK